MPIDPSRAGATDKLLAAFDFSRQLAEQNQRSQREIETILGAFLHVLDTLQALERHCLELVQAGHEQAPARSASVAVKLALRELASIGVEPLSAVGGALDLERHEVVEVRPVPDTEPDRVIEETVRGYTWKGRLLRRSRVIISGPAAASLGPGNTL